MELYCAVIGKGQELWKNELAAIKVPYQARKDKPKQMVRLGVAECKIYKVYFPEDQLDNVMTVLGVPEKQENYATAKNPQLNWFIKQLMKFLHLEAAPIPEKVVEHMQPDQFDKSVVVIPLGTRKDHYGPDGIENI